ncbi:MAG: signal peptide peptidase SppA [Planctomycetota bacterium]
MSDPVEPSRPRPKRPRAKWPSRLLWLILLASLGLNWWFWSGGRVDVAASKGPAEQFVEGDRDASEKIARIEVSGTIMPPLTGRVIDEIEAAADDDGVRGVLLVVDSPGGLVADSHRIWHRLNELAADKPVTVSFGRLAASGGYYLAMGAGPDATIYAEPTTWTGSIGVIIPRYDLTGFGEKFGVASDSLKTGPYKDALNPLSPLSDGERAVWGEVLDESFSKFVDVIVAGRPDLDEAAVRELATGQIYTADQALENGLVDELGYDDDALEFLKTKLGLTSAKVVKYRHPPDWSSLFGGLIRATTDRIRGGQVSDVADRLADAARPRAYYLFGASAAARGAAADGRY